MAESIVNVTEGSGKKLHTWNRTVGANAVEDEFTLPGEYPYPSYSALGANPSMATINDHLLQLMAGASLNLRIRRILVVQGTNATAAAVGTIDVWRVSSAGTGGTVVTPQKYDPADAAAGATAMQIPTAKGTEAFLLLRETFNAQQTSPVSPNPNRKTMLEWVQQPGTKPIIIPAGVANGIVIKNGNALAGATCNVLIEFVETSF